LKGKNVLALIEGRGERRWLEQAEVTVAGRNPFEIARVKSPREATLESPSWNLDGVCLHKEDLFSFIVNF